MENLKYLKMFENFESNDAILKANINKLVDDDVHAFSRFLPAEYYDGDEEKCMNGILNVIKKVNPNADLEKKKMSLSRDFDETCENLRKASWKSYSVTSGIKDFFLDNLYMFR